MRRSIENGFELTGPIERGDWETVERHLEAIAEHAPHLLAAYDELARLTAGDAVHSGADVIVARTVAEVRAALADRRGGAVGLVPTMGALHAGHLALLAAARDECDTVVLSLFVNPAQFGEPADLDGYPRDEERDLGSPREAGVDVLFAPSAAEMYPPGFQTWVDVTELGAMLEGEHRPGHFRGVATVCLKLFNIVRPDLAYFGQKDAQQVAVVRRMVPDLDLELELVRRADRARRRRPRALLAQRAPLAGGARARAGAPARARDRATRRPPARSSRRQASTSTTSRSPPSTPPTLAAAVRVGSTRLIDNVLTGGGIVSTRPRTPAPDTPAPGKLPLTELAEHEGAAAADRDGHRLRRAVGPPRRRGRRRPDPRRRLGRDDRARPRLDRARDDGRDARAHARGDARRAPPARRRATCRSARSRSPTRGGRRTRSASSRRPAPTRSSSRAPGRSLSRVQAIVGAGIPVMGHIGLTPQSATMLGGFKAQGRTAEKARRLVDDALALEAAGCFAIVLEAVPAPVAARDHDAR